MLNTREIVGFPQLRSEESRDGGPGLSIAHFELIAELRRQRQVEIARLTQIASWLTGRFGPETAVGFLYYEIVGRPPDRDDLRGYSERLYRTPSIVPIIVEELLACSQQ